MPDHEPWSHHERERFEERSRDLWSDLYRKHGQDLGPHHDKAVEKLREDINASLLRRRLDESGVAVTSDDRDAILAGSLTSTPALVAVRGWLTVNGRGERDPRMLVLLGSVGIGKTVAAAWALYEFGAYVVPDQLRERQHPSRRRDENLAPPKGVDGRLVVLDDIGTETDPRFGSAFFELINARMRTGRLTIVTGNLTKAQMRERYDARIVDRLNHCAKVVELSGKSLRRGGGGL